MPLLAIFGVTLIVILAAIVLTPLAIVQRYRLGTARRRARSWVASINAAGLALSAVLFLGGAAVTSLWIPYAFSHALAGLLGRIVDSTISGKIAKEVFEAMWSEGKDADAVIEARGLKQITDSSAIETAIDQVIAANPSQLADYRAGKEKLFGFFVGQVMKATGGKANPAQLNELLKRKLK